MPESLIKQLPRIVAEGKKEVERILDRLSGPNRLALQTNEYVLPSKDKSGLFRGEIKDLNEQEWHNRLIYGDNLLVMQALLAGDPATGLSSMRGKIRFSSLQYLSIKKPVITSYSSDIDEIKIELDNYILLSPDALPLDDENREKLQDVIAKEPLALIEYWSVDPDYDGETFRSKWQDYRGNTENDNDQFRVVKEMRIMAPKVKGKRKICVKAVDVFGFESVVVEEVD